MVLCVFFPSTLCGCNDVHCSVVCSVQCGLQCAVCSVQSGVPCAVWCAVYCELFCAEKYYASINSAVVYRFLQCCTVLYSAVQF